MSSVLGEARCCEVAAGASEQVGGSVCYDSDGGHGEYGGGDYEEEAEEVVEEEEVVMDEEEMLRMLDQMEPPLSVCQRLFKAESGSEGPWLVLSADQRASLRQRGFVVLDGLAAAGLAGEAYEEATARAASGSLTPAHGNGSGSGNSGGSAIPEEDCALNQEATGGAQPPPPELTGYVKSVRDDLTAFVTAEREAATPATTPAKGAAACTQGGAIGRILAVLAMLGEDVGRMVRLKGQVEHQLAVYPAGVGARYQRHRDAYPDDGCDDNEGQQKRPTSVNADHEAKNDEQERQGGVRGGDESGSVSFRRITAICYLRGSGSPWRESDGGALRLYLPTAVNASTNEQVPDSSCNSRVIFKFASQLDLSDEDNSQQQPGAANSAGGGGGGREGRAGVQQREDFVDIAPLPGRAVVFLSGAVEHEVLPVAGPLPRAALTTWFH